MDELPLNIANTQFGSSGVASAGYYLYGNQTGQKIGLVPIPTQTATNNITVWGVVAPADLALTTDSVNIPYVDAFSYLIALRAAAILLRKGQQQEVAASQYFKDYDAGIVKMQNFLRERQADGVWMIQDVQMEDIQFDDPL